MLAGTRQNAPGTPLGSPAGKIASNETGNPPHLEPRTLDGRLCIIERESYHERSYDRIERSSERNFDAGR
jgi:hypothetical protein